MQKRALAALYVLAALTIGALIFFARSEPARPKEPLLSAIPADALFVMNADLARLRSSPLFAPLLKENRSLPEVGNLRDLCGFDPMTRLDEIALVLPPGDDEGLGIVATGAIEKGEFIQCASRLIEKRGGEAKVERVAGFALVHDAKGMMSDQIALQEGGPVWLGERGFIDYALGERQGASSSILDTAHASLRQELGDGLIRATMVVSDELRNKARAERGALDLPALEIESIGAVVSTGRALELRGIARCQTIAACASLADSLRENLEAQKGTSASAFLGLLNHLRIEARGKRLVMSFELSEEDASRTLSRFITWRALVHKLSRLDEEPRVPPRLRAMPADEIIESSD